MKNRIATAASVFLLCSIIYLSCSKSSSSNNNTSNNSPNTVTMAGMAFSPGTITVSAGTTITWKNNDNMAHTVTADDNSFDSGNIGAGSSYSKTFSVAGTYNYHCTIHAGMNGKVVVQ
jgi:plastocyanin